MHLKKMVVAFALAIVATTATLVTTSAPAAAAVCYGAGCNGLDPEGRCAGQTVGAMDVGDGMLELRWSRDCAANWGRFTAYTRTEIGYNQAGIGIYARVTVWNPNAPSYQTAHHALGIGESTWSYMTDGRPQACTGVEIFHFYKSPSGSMGDMQSQGWWWGPCY